MMNLECQPFYHKYLCHSLEPFVSGFLIVNLCLIVLQYVLEELNIRSLIPCDDTLKYASLRAEPDFRYEKLPFETIFFSLSRCLNMIVLF